MHHVEGNGPEDVSSTLSYQRDSVPHLLHYIGRFIFTLWFELPRYFLKKGRRTFAVKSGLTELFCYSAIAYLYFFVNRKAAIVTLLVPLIQMRIGMAVGNWGQHAFIDRDDPDSDFRSSITLIDVSVSSAFTAFVYRPLVLSEANASLFFDVASRIDSVSMTAIILHITYIHADIGETIQPL